MSAAKRREAGVAGRYPIPAVLDDLLVADDTVLVQEASIVARPSSLITFDRYTGLQAIRRAMVGTANSSGEQVADHTPGPLLDDPMLSAVWGGSLTRLALILPKTAQGVVQVRVEVGE
ncbi:hypothetical protein [Microbispora sp. NBC_01389]|uniref:hypothetical protein n=1 Tax=Microbispora sp. NBC_01389 TaxID=2903584 RepID=UPI003247BF61